ncbi:MAG: hypothetical protein IJY09_00025 [Lachnospiraceae bacterium]|nr:hypothetical protein [Lachnospiraceae bacterium]
MNEKAMIDDLVKMLDSGMTKGVGHVNVDMDQNSEQAKSVQTMGCTDCSKTPMACSVPTLEKGLDDRAASEPEQKEK